MREGLARGAGRLRNALLPGLAFGLVAIVADELERLPGDIGIWLAHDAAAPALLHDRLMRAACGLALVLAQLLTLAALARTRTTLLERPARFIGVLVASGTAGLLAWSAAAGTWPRSLEAIVGAIATGLPRPALRAWSTMAMWTVLWGWLFFHHLRQRDDDRRLTLVLARRASLVRQGLEARLSAARSQVEPAMVAQVLRRVQALAAQGGEERPSSPPVCAPVEGAVHLVDRLSDYLRQLLQRARRATPELGSDLALLRSWSELQASQQGHGLELSIDPAIQAQATRPAQGCFLVARTLLAAALAQGAAALRLSVAMDGDRLVIDGTFGPALQWEPRAIEAAVSRLQPGVQVHHHITASGRRVVAHVPFR